MKNDDKLYMAFSGSGVGPNYSVGLLELSASDNPLNPNAWIKYNYPVMHSLSQPGEYGPGHNMFVQDKHGDWFNVYHACGIQGGHRHASMKPVHFRFDGSPILDMRNEEDLSPDIKSVTLDVVVD
ncbi:family 43 glycosylhydrolase [Paenibacillus tundrae]